MYPTPSGGFGAEDGKTRAGPEGAVARSTVTLRPPLSPSSNRCGHNTARHEKVRRRVPSDDPSSIPSRAA